MKTYKECKWRWYCIGAAPDGNWTACGSFEEDNKNEYIFRKWLSKH